MTAPKRVARENLFALTLSIFLLVSIFLTQSVKAQDGPMLVEWTRFEFRPYWDLLNGFQPYVAGYMTVDYLSNDPVDDGAASALGVTVSFAGTDKSVIQSDNALAAGIAAQGPDSREGSWMDKPWIDWGHLLLLVLDGVEDAPYIQGMVWKCYEWGRNGGYPIELPVADLVSSWTWRYPDVLTINSEVTLDMIWNSTHLNYFAKINGTEYSLYSYLPEPEAIRYFKVSLVHREYAGIPLSGTVKFFQFPGAWSMYNIGSVGWLSHLSLPSFIRTNETSWRTVRFAYAVHGSSAYLDNSMVWGGSDYLSVDAHYPLEPYGIGFGHVIFYPRSDGIVIWIDTLLWDPTCDSGGACPFVYTWNGQHYVIDNNILPASEMSNGSDVDDHYRLEQKLIPTYRGINHSIYSLQIHEFEHEHDYLDQVKLLAVDHPPDVNVAVTPYGEILTYSNPVPPVSALDEDDMDILSLLSSDDGNYYQGHNGSYITLTFAPAEVSNGVKLVIREDGPTGPPLLKCPVYVQVLNTSGNWNTVAKFHTRTYWATDIINMADHWPDAEGNLKVRLCFISNDKIDYIGLDTTPQTNIQVHQAALILAIHSTQGNVNPKLIENDQAYAELVPGEQIYLAFLLPNSQNEERTFILYGEGYYCPIT